MPMPTHSEISKALLEALKDGQPHALEDLRAYVIRRFNITEQELAEKNARGKPMLLERLSRASRPLLAERLTRASRPLLLERLSRAIWLLKDAEFIVKPQYATYAITQKGLDALKELDELDETEVGEQPLPDDETADIYDDDDAETDEETKDDFKDLKNDGVNNVDDVKDAIGEIEEIKEDNIDTIDTKEDVIDEPDETSEILSGETPEVEQENLTPEETTEIQPEEIAPENLSEAEQEELAPEETPDVQEEFTPEEPEEIEKTEEIPEVPSEIKPEIAPEADFQIDVVPDAVAEEAEENENLENSESDDDGITIDDVEDEDKEAEAEVEAEIKDGELEIIEGEDAEIEQGEDELQPTLQIEDEIISSEGTADKITPENLPEEISEAEEAEKNEVKLEEGAEETEDVEEKEIKEVKEEVEEVEEVEKVEENKEVEPESKNIKDDDNIREDDVEMSNSGLGHELLLELASVFEQFNETMTFEILDNVYGLSDAAFEQFVIDLLSKMGYRAFQNARYTSLAGESDIHGLIIDDKQGLSPIYIHATRQDPASVIDDSEIGKFAETVANKDGRGLFVTTAKFSETAEEFAKERDMLLIDGYKLARLMMANNFCVKLKDAFEVKAFDSEAFSDYED